MRLPNSNVSLTQCVGSRGPVVLVLALVSWSGVLLQLWLSLRLAQANGKSLAAGRIKGTLPFIFIVSRVSRDR